MRKSILCLLLSVILVFNSGYKAHVEALSLVVIGSVTLGEALLYCACVVGTTVAVVENEKHFQEQQMETLQNSDVYEPYGEEMLQDFKDWCSNCPQYVDMTTRNIEDWLANVVEGTLDKGSEVWSAFKDYICHVNDVQVENNAIFNQGTQEVTVSFSQIKQAIKKIDKNVLNNSYVEGSKYNLYDYTDYNTYAIANDGISVSVALVFRDNTTLVVVSNAYAKNPDLIGSFGVGSTSYYTDSKGVEYVKIQDIRYNTKEIDNCPNFGGTFCQTNWNENTNNVNYRINIDAMSWQMGEMLNDFCLPYLIVASGVVNGYWDFSIPVPDWGIADDVVIDKNVQDVIERDGTLDNVDVWGYGDMTLDKDDVISIDWDNVTVGDIARPYVGGQTLAVDLVDGIDISTDTPIEDIPVLPVAIRDSYTIPKLETVFPFCIPFDLVKIFTLFKAEPDAPHFTWTFYFGIGELKPYTIEIDLDPFNSVAEIVRLLELIGFLVFLTLKTRDLIRG